MLRLISFLLGYIVSWLMMPALLLLWLRWHRYEGVPFVVQCDGGEGMTGISLE